MYLFNRSYGTRSLLCIVSSPEQQFYNPNYDLQVSFLETNRWYFAAPQISFSVGRWCKTMSRAHRNIMIKCWNYYHPTKDLYPNKYQISPTRFMTSDNIYFHHND